MTLTRLEMGNKTFTYRVFTGAELNVSLAEELSRVFSTSYGKWSLFSPFRPGEAIRLSPERFLRAYSSPDFRITVCFCGDQVVGQAVYLDVLTSKGRVAFVVQLVVDKAYRRRGIAKTMLHSIWGFSNYYAYGIVTSSPCTVAALEAATFRRGASERICQDAVFLREEVFSKIDFLRKAEWLVSGGMSVVNTTFWTDRTQIQRERNNFAERYGRLDEGWEWIAVTFRDQPLTDLDSYALLVDSSGEFVREAYRRMLQSHQPWARQSRQEIAEILSMIPELNVSDSICDFGAGSGRHIHVLRDLGYQNVTGIDSALSEEGKALGVVEGDCRNWRGSVPYKVILCLFDVIGSFAEEFENKKILENIAINLKEGGYAVISVANYRFEKQEQKPIQASDCADELLQKIFRLSPSRVMATNGEFFSGDYLVNTERRLFYHKEQFDDPEFGLPAEYLVVDRRFTCEEIKAWIKEVGMEVVTSRFVRAGFHEDFSEQNGKEILVIARKVCA